MRRITPVLCCILVTSTAFAEEPGRRPTFESVFEQDALALEQLSGVTWLPDAEHFIYFTSRGEQKTLWRGDISGGAPVELADWTAVMKSLSDLRPDYEKPVMSNPNSSASLRVAAVLSPDGTTLVGGFSGDLFLFNLASKEAKFLTSDSTQEIFPAFSPDGTELGFVKNGDVHRLNLETGAISQVTDRGERTYLLNGVADWVYEEELDVERSYWWSPDGSKIAFLQFDERPVGIVPITGDSMPYPELEEQWYPKAGTANPVVKLGVVDLEGGDPSWFDTGEGDFYLPRAGWTPSGEVWVQRLNRDQTEHDLMVGDPKTGKVRTLLTDRDPAWINIRDDLHFLADGRFLWTSERDGWRHLYLYTSDGRSSRQLTSGEWQIENLLGADSDQQNAVIVANRGDHRQRTLFRVDLSNGAIQPIGDSIRGVHSGTVAPDGSYVIDQWSALDMPPRADLIAADGTIVGTFWKSGDQLRGWDLLWPEPGSVTADDGTELFSLLFRPRNFDPTRRYPVVLYVYGGPHSQLTADRWGGSVHNTYRLLAEMGIAVFLVDNRGTWGRGHAFEAAVHRRLGQLEVADQLAAARWLERQSWVDRERIAVYGGSYGGYMTLLCLLKAPEVFHAGVAYAPVTDWALYDTIYTERYMDTPRDNPQGYEVSAPLTYAEDLDSKLLLAHGTMDNNVHFQNSLQMIGKLAAADKEFELVIYPRTRHGIRLSNYRLHFHRKKFEFFKKYLLDNVEE
jgi:dipeptidyl-peptidase-4